MSQIKEDVLRFFRDGDALSRLIAYLLGSIGAMLAVVAVVSFLTQRSGARLLPLLVGGTGALSILTGAIWLQKTSGVLL